jgi:hypothetical protein
MACDEQAIAEIVRMTRASQGLPPTVNEPAVLARLAALIRFRHPDAGPTDRVD